MATEWRANMYLSSRRVQRTPEGWLSHLLSGLAHTANRLRKHHRKKGASAGRAAAKSIFASFCCRTQRYNKNGAMHRIHYAARTE